MDYEGKFTMTQSNLYKDLRNRKYDRITESCMFN